MTVKAILRMVAGLLILAGLAGVWHLQKQMDVTQASVRVEQDQLTLRSPGTLRKMSLEYAPLMAALYWTRAVQYYGEKHRLHQTNLELLWPLLDIATTLDPQIIPAYRFGSIFLGQKPPGGAGQADLAVQLLQRGIQANPEEWHLYQDLGNLYYFDLHDYAKASAAFEEGSKNPSAYIWMKTMAAKIAAEGESPETSFFLWQQIYDTTKDPQIKKNAEEHLILMRAQLDLKAINQLADQYEQRTGHRPTRMAELIEAGLIRGVPRDADGYPYVLDESGRAKLNADSPLVEKGKKLDRR